MASNARGVTRVLLLADAPVLRRGLVSMINETAGMQSVGTPGELRRALTLVESARPDAVVDDRDAGEAAPQVAAGVEGRGAAASPASRSSRSPRPRTPRS